MLLAFQFTKSFLKRSLFLTLTQHWLQNYFIPGYALRLLHVCAIIG